MLYHRYYQFCDPAVFAVLRRMQAETEEVLFMLDKNSPVPLYYQIMEDIKAQLKAGKLSSGEKLPTEQWLCQHYDVSRVTIRKALSELIASGLVQGRRGKGYYVTTPDINLSIAHMASLHKTLTASGILSTSRVLSIRTVSAPPVMVRSTGINLGENVIEVHRIRYANGSPISDQTSYLVERMCRGLPLEKLSTCSLYDMFQEHGIEIGYSNQTFMAALPDDELRKNLQLTGDCALLSIHAAVFTTDDRAVEYSINKYVPDRYSYSIRLDYLSNKQGR